MAGRNENGQGTFVKLDNDKWQCKIQCTSKTADEKTNGIKENACR